MKKIFSIILLSGLMFAYSCNYLDVVPDEVPTESDAFKDRKAAERFLYSCYYYLPDPRQDVASIDLFTADEVVTPFEHETFANFPKGNYTSVNPVISYWNTLFQGIRQCYIMLDNVDNVPGLEIAEKTAYKAEATFLIAYYHFLLLKCYGPTIIIRSTPSLDMPTSDYPARETYDECVNWIAEKFDEAVTIGLSDRHSGSAYGRATSVAARAIKGRMLLYAASPLFNGGKSSVAGTDDLSSRPEYANFKNAEGVPLICHTYDAAKWQRAADANLAAINAALATGVAMYNNGTATADQPEPSNPTERKLRMTVCDRTSSEIIWASTRTESSYALQNKSTPFDPNRDWSWNGIAPTLTMLESFYTAAGLPIDEDPAFNYAGRYGTQTVSDAHTNGQTSILNLSREPRFYAWVAHHNGFYEIQRSSSVYRYQTKFMQNDDCGIKTRTNNYSPTGYLNKKGVHPLYAQGSGGGGLVQYSWPIVRLGELYLNYAEALIEAGGQDNLNKAIVAINEIRTRAGIPAVETSWAGTTLDQDRLRRIVRQERTIELYLENHRFWDVRRWLLGTKYFNVMPRGLNIRANGDDFFNPQQVEVVRKFIVPAHYLMPIPGSDIDKNPKVIQNPGY
ncbi:MAG: RagB/SusD family nutrient uptake outer membrane protein [Prevotellaceae bacterium]|nr:RagB/SusD family nutrient uptake outer membrane protein [Prevotellaceae bacterium]